MVDVQEDFETIRDERDGYRHAYSLAQPELNALRVSAAPVIRRAQNQAEGAGRPSIFLVTLPKSGTVYVSHTLRLTTGFDHTATLVTPTFPKNLIWPQMLEDFLLGGMISVSHLQPDRENIVTLKAAGCTKGVLHVRDPRAALYSWVKFASERVSPFHGLLLRADYRSLSENQQIDHAIAHAFPLLAGWLEKWCNTIDGDPELDYLMLDHHELASQEEDYFSRLMSFYNIEAPLVTAAKTAELHFRSGSNEDWRVDFSAPQTKLVNDLMPPLLWRRFGWRP